MQIWQARILAQEAPCRQSRCTTRQSLWLIWSVTPALYGAAARSVVPARCGAAAGWCSPTLLASCTTARTDSEIGRRVGDAVESQDLYRIGNRARHGKPRSGKLDHGSSDPFSRHPGHRDSRVGSEGKPSRHPRHDVLELYL